jgi:hypothetical protein
MSHITRDQLPSVAAANNRKTCVVKGCQNPRAGNSLSSYCHAHKSIHNYRGDPTAPVLPVTVYRYRERWVRRLLSLKENADRSFLTSTVSAFQSLLDESIFAEAPSALQRMLLDRVVSRQVSAFDLVVRLCSLSLWLHENPKVMPSDRAEEFAMARAVLSRRGTRSFNDIAGHRPGVRRLNDRTRSSTALAALGSQCRKILAGLMPHVIVAHEAVRTRAPAMRDPSRPFMVPRAATLARKKVTGFALRKGTNTKDRK